MNRPVMTSGPVMVQVHADAATERQTLETSEELQVWVGGPVEPQRSWILVGNDEERCRSKSGASASSKASTFRLRRSCSVECSGPHLRSERD